MPTARNKLLQKNTATKQIIGSTLNVNFRNRGHVW